MIPSLTLMLALVGCPKPEPPVFTPVVQQRPPQPIGQVRGGRFHDDERGFSVGLPEDWQLEPGAVGEDLRATLTHVVTQAVLEIAVYPERSVRPKERDSCLWTFQDEGVYTALQVEEDVTVAGCTPWDPTGARVQGWYTVTPTWAYHLELILADGYLVPGLDEGESLIRTFRVE